MSNSRYIESRNNWKGKSKKIKIKQKRLIEAEEERQIYLGVPSTDAFELQHDRMLRIQGKKT